MKFVIILYHLITPTILSMTHKLNTTLIFTLLLSLQLSAQQATLLYDINPGFATGIQSDAAALAGGKYFFHGKTVVEGQELWVTDGTSAGTHLVKDIDPGVASGTGGKLIAFKDKVWFKADETNAGAELCA
jgi:ELWxxDGT repeat protein